MQKIMIVSDTHRAHINLDKALEREGEIDMLIHLGDIEGDEEYIEAICDCEVIMVPGNNDYYSNLKHELEINIGKYKCLLTHGHNYYVSLDLSTIREEAIARGFDIVMFGHTHRPVIQIEDEVTLINPGSISYPRQADRKPTYIMMELDKKGDCHFTLKNI